MNTKNKKKIICFAIHSLQLGGMERVMAILANYFAGKDEVNIHLILYGKTREIFFPISSDIIIHRPRFAFSDHARIISTLKTLLFIRKTAKKMQPDVILSFGELWNSFVLLALLGTKFPVYISDRCKPTKSFSYYQNMLRRWLYPKAAGMIAQTSTAKNIYQQQHLNNNIRVIGNPVYKLAQNGTTERQNIILTVGRLIETKHHDRLIKMFKDLDQPGWKLVIAGDDALKQSGMKKLKALIDELDMNERVELTGRVTDIASYYHRSKIFAFTSSSEGFPNVIAEAMSAGLPVIAYDCVAGPSDLIEDEENGFLIPLFNDRMYEKKLQNLMNDEKLQNRMGKTSKELVKKFSIKNTAERYYQFVG